MLQRFRDADRERTAVCGEADGRVQFDKFREIEPRPLDAAQELHGRTAFHEDDVVLPGEELRQVLEVAREFGLRAARRERGPLGHPSLGKRVEEKDARGAATRLRIHLELRNEPLIEARRAPALDIQSESLGTLRRQGKLQLPAERIPIAFVWVFPAAEPLQSVGDVADLVAVDAVQQTGGGVVSRFFKRAPIMTREIEVRLLECQAKPGDVVDRVFHGRDGAPEVTADGQFAEVNAALPHPREIESRVFLFVLQGLQDTHSESGGRVGKSQEHQGHQLRCQQFVIGEEVEQPAAVLRIADAFDAGKRVAPGAARFEAQFGRAPRPRRSLDRRARLFVGNGARGLEFLLQRGGEQHALGEFAEFHGVDLVPPPRIERGSAV